LVLVVVVEQIHNHHLVVEVADQIPYLAQQLLLAVVVVD